MTNAMQLPLPMPVGPSPNDVNEMARIQKILAGTNHGHPSNKTAAIQAAKNPFTSPYNDGFYPTDDVPSSDNSWLYGNTNSNPYASPYTSGDYYPIEENINSFKPTETSIADLQSGITPSPVVIHGNMQNAPMQETISSGKVSVIGLVNEDTLDIKFAVVDSNRKDLISNINLKESAVVIAKLLSNGYKTNDKKVKEMKELDVDYHAIINEMECHKDRYTRANQLNESSSARIFKVKYEEAKAESLAIGDKIKSIIDALG